MNIVVPILVTFIVFAIMFAPSKKIDPYRDMDIPAKILVFMILNLIQWSVYFYTVH